MIANDDQHPVTPDDEEAALTQLPKELGVMLVSAGVIGLVLPGPGAPALVAGGLILSPRAFGQAERWFRDRFPQTHRRGMNHLRRFLDDLERRYPGSTASDAGTGDDQRDQPGLPGSSGDPTTIRPGQE